MNLLIALLLLWPTLPVMPPPWEPPQPVTLPLRVEATGGADVLPIPNDDGTVISVNIRPADGQPCWAVHMQDSAGQVYDVFSPRGTCNRTLYLPFAETTP